MNILILFYLNSCDPNDIRAIKSRIMRRGDTEAHITLIGKSEGTRQHGEQGTDVRIILQNILKGIMSESMDCLHSSQDSLQRRPS
jgi:hypothetical protein